MEALLVICIRESWWGLLQSSSGSTAATAACTARPSTATRVVHTGGITEIHTELPTAVTAFRARGGMAARRATAGTPPRRTGTDIGLTAGGALLQSVWTARWVSMKP